MGGRRRRRLRGGGRETGNAEDCGSFLDRRVHKSSIGASGEVIPMVPCLLSVPRYCTTAAATKRSVVVAQRHLYGGLRSFVPRRALHDVFVPLLQGEKVGVWVKRVVAVADDRNFVYCSRMRTRALRATAILMAGYHN